MNSTERDRIRVAHVIDSLGVGGAEQALLSLAPNFYAKNIDIIVVPLFKDRTLEMAFLEKGIEVAQIDFFGKWHLLKNTKLLLNSLREKQIDAVHAHLFFSGIYIGLTKLFGLNLVRVISFHNLAYAKGCNPKNLGYFLRKSLNWFVLRYCYDHVFAVSNAVAEHYTSHLALNRNRLSILPNGMDIESYIGDSYLLKLPEKKTDCFRFVALGRLVKEKGYEDLLQAFSILHSKADLQLELVIIGGGPLEKELRFRADELNIAENVSFAGSVSHEEAKGLLATADTFVCSSIFEGFGIAVAEAALLKKLIVATQVGGITDVVNEETAILVNPSNPDELAEGMLQAIFKDDKERDAMTALSKSKVIELCSIHSVVNQLVNVYDSLLFSKGLKH